MESEGSLLYSQDPFTEPDKSVHITPYLTSILILSSYLHLWLPSAFFPIDFLNKFSINFSHPPYVLRERSTSSLLI